MASMAHMADHHDLSALVSCLALLDSDEPTSLDIDHPELDSLRVDVQPDPTS